MNAVLTLDRLDWTIYLSWIGVAVVLFLPKDKHVAIRWTALTASVLGLVVAAHGLFTYELARATTFANSFAQFEVKLPWIDALGITYHLGADGISLPLLVLNGIVAVTGVLFSWNVEHRVKEFFAFFLLLISGVYGVFLSLDMFLLFAFYELAIIPKYFVIAIWGSTRKEYAAMKLVLYSFVGSALVLIGLLAMFFANGATTFDMFALMNANFSESFQFWCFPFVFVGFAVLAGMWPFHTWAPTGHAAAPTAASMLLAGVVMKLGAYGCLRVAMLLLPQGLTAHGGFWQWTIAILAVIGIVYGAAVALVQKDFKFVIGYSSVSHMGFVLLGLMTLNSIGLDGAILQMFSHGIVASLLFAVVGRMVYERTHTRDLDALARMELARKLPLVCTIFVVGGLASMGMPGFSGFVAEVQVLVGAWQRFPVLVFVSGAGIVITVWYTLRAVHLAFFGERRFALGPLHVAGGGAAEHGAPRAGGGAPAPPVHTPHHDAHALSPLTLPEKVAAAILVALLVIVGLYPRVLLDVIDHSVHLMLPILTATKGGGA